jgi:hypothetical protein
VACAFRECLKVAIERGRQLHIAAAALTDDQHLVVLRAVERLQELLHLINSDLRDEAAMTDDAQNLPSDEEWFTFSGPAQSSRSRNLNGLPTRSLC